MNSNWMSQAAVVVAMWTSAAAYGADFPEVPMSEPESCLLTPLALTPPNPGDPLFKQSAWLAAEGESKVIWTFRLMPIANPDQPFNKVNHWPVFVPVLQAAIQKGEKIAVAPCPVQGSGHFDPTGLTRIPRYSVEFGRMDIFDYSFYSCIAQHGSYYQRFCKKP